MQKLIILFLGIVVLVSGCVSPTPPQNKCTWEAGPCEMLIADGYYFDSGANQCKEVKGASGCSDSPFKNLDECQNTCGGSVVLKSGGEECGKNTECLSGVCDLYKQQMGKCSPLPCTPGEKTNHNDFYCDQNGKWQKPKQAGDACVESYECFQPNCYEVPDCSVREKASCEENICIEKHLLDECEQKGLKKILRADQYSDDCFKSMAQMTLPTVCAPCGDGDCDQDETKCNCPEDCSS